jgi:hypothetical protein
MNKMNKIKQAKELWKIEKRIELMELLKQIKLKQYVTEQELNLVYEIYDEFEFSDDKEVKRKMKDFETNTIMMD